MIFYFSGTGNSQWVAHELAQKLNDKAVSIVNLQPSEIELTNETYIGFVFPIYAWGVSEPMRSFVQKLSLTQDVFCFGICTYGSEASLAMHDLASLVHLDSVYGIAMPNNYVIGSDLEKSSVVKDKLHQAADKLDRIASEIASHTPTTSVHEGGAAFLKSKVANWGFNQFARSTKSFMATDACVSCGQCEVNCPAAAIELRNGRPVWHKATCYICLRCINACPVAAIQYGKATADRSRYTIERYLTE